MAELICIKKEEAVTTSLQVAEIFGKRHSHVLANVYEIIKHSAEKSAQCFYKSYYIDKSGKRNQMYYMNRDGFLILAMGFKGKKALDFKWLFIEAFNYKETIIQNMLKDKLLQKQSMEFLQNNLQMPATKDYIKANTIADKCISNMYGYEKMVKKENMTPEMIQKREEVLKDTVELMAAKEKYKLNVKVSESIYEKYKQVI